MSRPAEIAIKVLRQREYGLILLIALVTAIVSAVDPGFLAPGNIKDILVRSAPTAIVACGVMLVVVTAEIDISVGSLMALLAALLGLMISRNEWQLPMWIGIPAVLLCGTLIGLLTGALVTLGKVPSIIVTLGLLTALRGATTLLMRGENIDGLPEGLQSLAKVGVLGLPLSVWTAMAVLSVTGMIITQTALGRRLFALGSSAYAARMTGLSATRLKLFAFAYTGFLTALATVVDVPRLPKIESGIGTGFELLVITCVVVGGVSVSGGRGRLAGVVLAVVLLTMVRPVLTFSMWVRLERSGPRPSRRLFSLLAVLTDTVVTRRPAARGRPLPDVAPTIGSNVGGRPT
jgi:ribose/xylose/arabinose/galactoside ABC-type transport system permease subunit